MKLVCLFLAFAWMLVGCGNGNEAMNRGVELRTRLLNAQQCSFDAKVTADYGERVQIFAMECKAEPDGKVLFCVTLPERISNISGNISAKGGEITFDDVILTFPLLADDQLSPISGPWVLMRMLRSGVLKSAGEEERTTQLSLEDQFEGKSLLVDVWIDETGVPVQGDILCDGRRILTIEVTNFQIQ